jgi:hypothetical protein
VSGETGRHLSISDVPSRAVPWQLVVPWRVKECAAQLSSEPHAADCSSVPLPGSPCLSLPLPSQLWHFIIIQLHREFSPPLWSGGHSSWLQIQRSGFDSRHHTIFWEAVGLERGPLGLVTTPEEVLGRKSSGFGLEIREYGRGDPIH